MSSRQIDASDRTIRARRGTTSAGVPTGATAGRPSSWRCLGPVLGLIFGLGCGGGAQGKGPVSAPREPLPRDIVARSAHPLYALGGPEQRERLDAPQLWERLAAARVICFGERHDSPEHHYAQWRALQELATRAAASGRPLAIGLEMFQRTYQAALTGFVAGATPEAQFLADSDYRQRWGFDFALYRPLLETAREFSLPALALNAPKELTRKISRGGLDGLDASERNQLPELDLENTDHQEYFEKAMSGHPMPDGAPEPEDMYAAQVVWDETMAETAADWLSKSGESSQLLVIAGAGHCHRSAIPARITRRIGVPVLSLSATLESELARHEDRHRYDWLVVLED